MLCAAHIRIPKNCNVWYEGILRSSQWSYTGSSWPFCYHHLLRLRLVLNFVVWVVWHFFLSSLEHKVLMVSFCDRPMSSVRRPSCVVHNFFKHLLNHWANLDETWQGCFLGEALPKLFKRLNSTNNSGCHGNRKKRNLKIFLCQTIRARAFTFGM